MLRNRAIAGACSAAQPSVRLASPSLLEAHDINVADVGPTQALLIRSDSFGSRSTPRSSVPSAFDALRLPQRGRGIHTNPQLESANSVAVDKLTLLRCVPVADLAALERQEAATQHCIAAVAPALAEGLLSASALDGSDWTAAQLLPSLGMVGMLLDQWLSYPPGEPLHMWMENFVPTARLKEAHAEALRFAADRPERDVDELARTVRLKLSHKLDNDDRSLADQIALGITETVLGSRKAACETLQWSMPEAHCLYGVEQ